jgi:hypothetical protein
LGIAVLAASGIAFRDRILEEYSIWRLENGSEAERISAARDLEALKSVRAVPFLMKALCRELYAKGIDQDHDLLKALGGIGKGAVPALLESLGKEADHERLLAACGLGQIGPNAKEAVPALRQLLERIKGEKEANLSFIVAKAIADIEASAISIPAVPGENLGVSSWKLRMWRATADPDRSPRRLSPPSPSVESRSAGSSSEAAAP